MKPLLDWKPEFAVGVASVDHEHQELIEAINQLADEAGQSGDRLGVEEALGEIGAAIAAHFALEENVMRKADYVEYRAHKEDHEALLEQLRDIMDDYADDPRMARRDLGERLSAWFGVHFSTFDARLHGALGV